MATPNGDYSGCILRSAGLTNRCYKLERKVGKGAQGDVFAATCHVDQQAGTPPAPAERVAIKLVRLPAGNRDRLDSVQKEIRISNLLSAHPHIVSLRDLVVVPPDRTGARHIGLVMELAKYSMQYVVHKALTNPLAEACVSWWFQQLVLAVEHCHEKQVGQRDIKPDNILVFGTMQIRLADFGLSKQLDISGAKTPTGTFIYMAPEIQSDAYQKYDAKKADVWSCGVVLFQLLFPTKFNEIMDGLKGSYNKRYTHWVQQLPEHGPLPDRNMERSEHAVSLLRQMLQEDPTHRITLSGVRQHPWFTSTGEGPTAAAMEEMQRVAKETPPVFADAKLELAFKRCLT